MNLAAKNTLVVAMLAAAVAAAGCGTGSGGSSKSLASSASTSTASITSGGPSAIGSATTGGIVTGTTAQVTSGHGVVDVRSASVWIVRDTDYAEFMVTNAQVLTAAGVKDGRTLVYQGDVAPTATNTITLGNFSADAADLHGRIVLWPPTQPYTPPPPNQIVAFQTDGGDVYTLNGALGSQALLYPGALQWRGIRVTGQVTLAPNLNTAGQLAVTSFDFDRVVQVTEFSGSIWGTSSTLCLDQGERWGEYAKRRWRFPRLIEHRAGALALSDRRTLDQDVQAADLFHKPDSYGRVVFGVPTTQLTYMTIDQTKTITIRFAAQLPAEIDALLKECETIRVSLPVI
jgi:hypothetical protein